MNGGFGVTRAAALNGWKSSEYTIGISGHMASPELALIFGASGATPFIAGLEKSQFIISINTDSHALIFKSSDVGIVEDSAEIAEELLKLIEEDH